MHSKKYNGIFSDKGRGQPRALVIISMAIRPPRRGQLSIVDRMCVPNVCVHYLEVPPFIP